MTQVVASKNPHSIEIKPTFPESASTALALRPEIYTLESRLIDSDQIQKFGTRLSELAKQKIVIIDASNCEFLRSSAFSKLVHASIEQKKTFGDDSPIRIVGLRRQMIDTLRVMQCEQLIAPFHTMDDALIANPQQNAFTLMREKEREIQIQTLIAHSDERIDPNVAGTIVDLRKDFATYAKKEKALSEMATISPASLLAPAVPDLIEVLRSPHINLHDKARDLICAVGAMALPALDSANSRLSGREPQTFRKELQEIHGRVSFDEMEARLLKKIPAELGTVAALAVAKSLAEVSGKEINSEGYRGLRELSKEKQRQAASYLSEVLGESEKVKSDKAAVALTVMGTTITPVLKAATKSENPLIAGRSRVLLAKIAEGREYVSKA